jgi:O-antigen ligase
MSFYTLLVFIIAGAIGAGYFHTRSFLALAIVLYTIAAVYIVWVKKLTLLPVHLYLLVIYALYWLAACNAADKEQAVLEAIKVSLLLPVSLLYTGLSKPQRDRLWAAWAWVGAGLTLWGLTFGLFREGRLESTLGYANVFAVVIAAGMAAGWRSYRLSGHKRYALLIAIQLCGLLLSGSRAVLVLVVVGTVVLLLIDKPGKLTVWSTAVVLAVLLTVVMAGMILGSGGIVREMGWNAPEFALRRIYWGDGLRIWKEHWLTGVGGGGFAVLYPSIFVKYVHQQYLQMALDTGIAGALAFIAMIISAAQAGLRRGRAGRSSLLALGLFSAHLAFDIDLAYPLVFGLLVMLLTEMELEGYKGKAVTFSGKGSASFALPCILAVCLLGWVFIGYMGISKGESATARGEWDKALQSLHTAETMLPWSHEVHYQLAAVYSGLAQSQGDKRAMKKAVEEIRKASSMVPKNKKYIDMLKKAGKS